MTRHTLAALLLVSLIPTGAAAQVSFERLLRADEEPENWLTYSGSYKSNRHSRLDQITPANVTDLEMRWVFQARSLEVFQATPLVVDGIMYLVEPTNTVVALDAKLGRVFWTYEYTPSGEARPCCGAVNRGARHPGQHPLSGDGRRQSARARCHHRETLVEDQRGRPRRRLRPHTGAAGHQGQSDSRHRRGRIRHPRLHCRLRRPDRGGGVEVLHDSRSRASRVTRPGRAMTGCTAARPSG